MRGWKRVCGAQDHRRVRSLWAAAGTRGGRRGWLGARAGCRAAVRRGARGRSGAPGRTEGGSEGLSPSVWWRQRLCRKLEAPAALRLGPLWAPKSRGPQQGPRVEPRDPGFCSRASEYRQLTERHHWANRAAWVGAPRLFSEPCHGPRGILSAPALLTTQLGPAGTS